MRAGVAPGSLWSPGERRMCFGYLIAAVVGLFLALIVVIRLDSTAVFSRGFTGYEIWILVSGCVGAVSGIYLSRHRLGRTGIATPALGITMAGLYGSIVAGTLALPLYGTMFGPFTLLVIFVASPFVAVLWLMNMTMVHLLFRSWHAERDSIFGDTGPRPLGDLIAQLRERLSILRA